MHTPDQARSLWCPMVRADRWMDDKHCCIAERCAMWRWAPGEGTHPERRTRPIKVAKVLGGYEDRTEEYTVQVPNAPTHGYCGLAGRPGAAS